jgi:U3 small nucleolar RNA-associated protein 19
MLLVKSEGRTLRQNQDHSFPIDFLTEIVRVLVIGGDAARKEFTEQYVEEYDDIRYYTLKALERILADREAQVTDAEVFDNALEILSPIEPPESKEELEDFYCPKPKKSKHDLYSVSKHKSRAQAAWLALLKLDMNKEQRKKVLGFMADTIAPWFLKPELLMDFLTDSYNTGGSISLLALSGVFYLISEKSKSLRIIYV